MELVSEINELFAESQPKHEIVTTEYSFVVQGVKVTQELPEELLIRFAKTEKDFGGAPNHERQLEQYDSAPVGIDDDCTCVRCQSPDARWVGVKIFTKYDYDTGESYERGERLRMLCNECIRLYSENRPGPNYQLPPSGDLMEYSRENTRENWQWR